jgi:hypothetical protein
MELTSNEREETLAICRAKAEHCRALAQRISHADQRRHMEETAKMWDALAASIGSTVVSAAG